MPTHSISLEQINPRLNLIRPIKKRIDFFLSLFPTYFLESKFVHNALSIEFGIKFFSMDLKLFADIYSKVHEKMCVFCLAEFNSTTALKVHKNIHKDEDRPYRCHEKGCESRFQVEFVVGLKILLMIPYFFDFRNEMPFELIIWSTRTFINMNADGVRRNSTLNQIVVHTLRMCTL